MRIACTRTGARTPVGHDDTKSRMICRVFIVFIVPFVLIVLALSPFQVRVVAPASGGRNVGERGGMAGAGGSRVAWRCAVVVLWRIRQRRRASGNNSVVECDLAKVEVAGSNPVSRSIVQNVAALWAAPACSATWGPNAHSAPRARWQSSGAIGVHGVRRCRM